MNYDFIEIGTSDFGKLEQSSGGWGLAIDPVESIIQNFPPVERVNRFCAAISNRNGRAKVYWIDTKDIIDYNLPDWIKGCNTIDDPHSKALELLKERGLAYLMNESYCEVMTWKALVKKCEIERVESIRVNTKMDDNLIVDAMLDYGAILPNKIQFENSGSEETMKTLQLFRYNIIESSGSLVTLQRES
jgi:hypothetical protein